MKFPADDPYWCAAVEFVKSRSEPEHRLFGPREFLYEFANLYGYGCGHAFDAGFFDLLIIHKGMVDCIATDMLERILIQEFVPAFADEVFVVLARNGRHELMGSTHYIVLLDLINRELAARHEGMADTGRTAAVMTTYNRSWALRRSLPQVARLDVPVLVVDDGSSPPEAGENRRIAEQHHAKYLLLPENRGVACAIGIGVEYWLADPQVRWISYHQDDTDVHPKCLRILTALGDPVERPILTGRRPHEYEPYGNYEHRGRQVYLFRDCPGHHLLAHRTYWSRVLPIPNPYPGAPKRDRGLCGMGPEEDHWITAWSPNSITKQNRFVTCVPDLVRTFAVSREESSWGHHLDRQDDQLEDE